MDFFCLRLLLVGDQAQYLFRCKTFPTGKPMAATLASYVRELLIKTPTSLLQRRCWTNWMALGVYIQARTIQPTRYRKTVNHGLLVKRRDWQARLARSMGRISPWCFLSQSYV